MTRFLLLIAGVGWGLLFLLFSGPVTAQAQVAHQGTDIIRFMAATRGTDYERQWHAGVVLQSVFPWRLRECSR